MKKLVAFAGASLGLILLLLTVRLIAVEVEKRQRISEGNEIVEHLEAYQQKEGILPNTDDWKALEDVGFEMTDLGTQPSYEKKTASSYKLVFLEGFDGPYLTYQSEKGKWIVE